MSVYDLYTKKKKKNDRRGKGNCRLDFSCADSKSIFRERGFLACVQTSPISFVVPRATKKIGDVCTQARGFPEATLLDKTDGKSRPHPPPISPQIKDGKMACFGLHAASSLIWWEMGVCCSILFLLTDCIYHHVKGNSILSKSSKDSALFIQPSRH